MPVARSRRLWLQKRNSSSNRRARRPHTKGIMSRALDAEWFWTDRWTKSRGFGLPMEARGLYREMLTQAWCRGAKLPSNPEEIRRITGCTEKEWQRAWPRIEKFWIKDPDGSLVNATQVVIYAAAKEAADRAKSRAQAGAQAKHKQHPSTAQALPSGLLSPDQRESKERSLSVARANGSEDPGKRAGRLLQELYPAWY